MTVAPIPATLFHARAMAEIHRAAFPPGQAWSAEVIGLHLGIPNAIGLVDPRGGMILARVAADEAEVVTLAVQPDLRRQGLASALLRAAMHAARDRGATVMFLEVAIDNHAARSLYSRAGFNEVGHRRRYYPDGGDALVMRADLVP
jgi:ribosomal-protein-alanine N-acetyltransferase